MLTAHQKAFKHLMIFRGKKDAIIARKYENGISSHSLAKEYGVSSPSIIKALARQGIKPRCPTTRNRRFSDDLEAQTAEQNLEGYSTMRLAKRYGCSDYLISSALERQGVETRSLEEASLMRMGRLKRRGA